MCLSTSAGVGRTGVFITLSIVLERMRYEGMVDLFQTVKTLRTQRPSMVQTEVGHFWNVQVKLIQRRNTFGAVDMHKYYHQSKCCRQS